MTFKIFQTSSFSSCCYFQGCQVRRHLNCDSCFLFEAARISCKISSSCFSRVTFSYRIKGCRESDFCNELQFKLLFSRGVGGCGEQVVYRVKRGESLLGNFVGENSRVLVFRF